MLPSFVLDGSAEPADVQLVLAWGELPQVLLASNAQEALSISSAQHGCQPRIVLLLM